MRGLASGSAERSQTWPRACGLTSTGAIVIASPSNSSSPCFSKYRAPMWNWMSAAGSPARVRTKATTSAAVEVSGPLRRSSHSSRYLGLSAP